MNDLKSKYHVDGEQMDAYLKNRFIAVSTTFSIVIVIIMSMFAFMLYQKQILAGLWSLLISIPIIIVAFLFGVRGWHEKLRTLSGTEFTLTDSSLIQKAPDKMEKYFSFSEIVVVDKKKFGTTIIKGNWLTRIDYYRPKNSPYQLDHPKLIFIPSITTHYSELVERIKQVRRLS